MKLMYLDQAAIDDMRINFSTYHPHFSDRTNEWFIKRFSDNNWLHESKIQCNDFTLNYDADFNVSDRKNIEIIYEAMRTMSPANALDERLWAGILFSQCWDYVKYRRASELASGDERDILNSFVFMRGTKRSCFINCLSRLWWTGFLLYDSSNPNPYESIDLITERAFASNIILISSNNYIANKELALGVMDSLVERHKIGEKITRRHYVEVNKYINCLGGTTLLDTMTRSEIKSQADTQLNKLFGVV